MRLFKAEEACAQTDQVIEEENKKRQAEAENYIDAHVYSAIKSQIANGCHSAVLHDDNFMELDFRTKQMVCLILKDYHYEARLDCDFTTLKISWFNKSEE